MVASENAEGNLKKLLSACRQLDKLRLHPRIVEAGDWQVVKWLAKRRVRGESALVRWAPMELFVWLAEQIVDLESAEIVALACISVACLLRVGEAPTVRTSTRGDVRFNGEKGRPGIWDVEVGPWTKWWVLFLWEIRRLKHGRADLPFSFQDAAGLQAGWKKIVGGSDFEGYRWHALRRCGAAVLWFWGARIQTVMLAGGWVTSSVAKDYCHPTHAWSCERRMHLQVPVDWGGGGGDRRSVPVQVRRTTCGQSVGKMGPSGICETLHLSDALGLRRVRSARRDGKEANPWSPRVPRAQSTTASPAAKGNTGSWSVTGDVLGGFGGRVERLMRLPDVPRKQEGLVAGGLMALGRLAATIDPRRGLARLTQALETISEDGLSQASEESYYDDDKLEPVSLQLARRGIGEVGKVRMANTIWRRYVPKDLLRTY